MQPSFRILALTSFTISLPASAQEVATEAPSGACATYAKVTSAEYREEVRKSRESVRQAMLAYSTPDEADANLARMDAASQTGRDRLERACELSKLPPPRVGMTKSEARKSSWGEPQHVNTTMTAAGTTEQWVYGEGKFLYFKNGVLDSAQY